MVIRPFRRPPRLLHPEGGVSGFRFFRRATGADVSRPGGRPSRSPSSRSGRARARATLNAMSGRAARWRAVAALSAAWFVFWAGFWLAFFLLIAVFDPGSIDPGEPAAFARVFAGFGVVSAAFWGVAVSLAGRRRAAVPGAGAAALWGAAAAAVPLLALAKLPQALVLGPVGAAIGGTLAFLARAGAHAPDGGGAGFRMARRLGRVFRNARGGGAEEPSR